MVENENTHKSTHKRLKAVCTWGDGPDVLLVNEGKDYMLYGQVTMRNRYLYGVSHQGSLDLTANEAEGLGRELLEAARQVKDMGTAWEREGKRING